MNYDNAPTTDKPVYVPFPTYGALVSGPCPTCTTRKIRKYNRAIIGYTLAKCYLVALKYVAIGAVVGAICTALFSLFVYTAQSGPMYVGNTVAVCWGGKVLPLGSRHSCYYYHAGWGWGPTSAYTVFILITILAALAVCNGNPKESL